MTNTSQNIPTRDQLRQADPAGRVLIVENYAIDLLTSLRESGSGSIEPGSHLADVGVDSLQAVELKYSLDELLGNESDVDLFISNPTIRTLAEELVRRARL
ncbi:MAG TPA: acyl carrier protein [Bryobacteraceae bacterium]|jgi:acyl carrier protein